MELRHLRALVAVAEEGGFSSAAVALRTVQSNVSAHVARLEEEVGATLVDRSAGGLTAEGEVVLARARRVLAETDALVSDVAALRNEVRGTARLGVIGTTGRWLAPLLLARLGQRHPGIHLVIVEGSSTSLEAELAAGHLDLALVNLPLPGHDLIAEPLFEEDLVLVVDAHHRWAARRQVRLADAASIPLLLPVRGSPFREEVETAARAAGVRLRIKAELDGIRLIASLTFEGHGPAILPATGVPSYLRSTWKSIRVSGLPRRRVAIATRRRGLPAPPARAVHDLLVESVAAGAGDQPGIHLIA